MHGDGNISINTAPNAAEIERPRNANDCFMDAKHAGPPRQLFDEFWREGELALLFGAAGTGKSVLAMQIADRIARGRGIDGFEMTAKRQRVLYVDLRLSDRHFNLRYRAETPKKGTYTPYKFADELYRVRPPEDADLCKWLRKMVNENHFRAIVIDDLSAVLGTCGGIRETLELMRKLRRLRDELDLSILVLAGCREPRRSELVSETDLQHSRVLCDTADSVFAIGIHPRKNDLRYLVQTRSAGSAIVWTDRNAPVASLSKIDGTLLGFTFDERFRPKYSTEELDLICNIKLARDRNATYRDLAYVYEISTSTAHSLLRKFQPWMLKGREHLILDHEMDNAPTHEEETHEQDAGDDQIANECVGEPDEAFGHASAGPTPEPIDDETPAEPPELKTPREILLALGMRQTFDENDREIFIEKENGPIRHVWYRFDARDRYSPLDLLSRHQSNGVGSAAIRVDGPISLFNSG